MRDPQRFLEWRCFACRLPCEKNSPRASDLFLNRIHFFFFLYSMMIPWKTVFCIQSVKRCEPFPILLRVDATYCWGFPTWEP